MTLKALAIFFAAIKDPEGTFKGNDKEAYRVDNLAFEPKNSVGEYQGVMRTDGKAGGRLELRDLNNKNNDKVDGRRNIQIHVGGRYTNSEGRRGVVGSLGCCTLSGPDKGNKGRDRFVSDVTERVKSNSEANKSNIILIKYIKRDEKPDFNK
ncbi:hypothetical protein [Sphingobacterium athyrii]|uniref:hypothetical protein n=1 Tax=Sphingobacterium athyrii TaxID=2152717 RepID=UPI0028A5BA0E|nr:hypothetical protein [Sphingobacterium athyrii]